MRIAGPMKHGLFHIRKPAFLMEHIVQLCLRNGTDIGYCFIHQHLAVNDARTHQILTYRQRPDRIPDIGQRTAIELAQIAHESRPFSASAFRHSSAAAKSLFARASFQRAYSARSSSLTSGFSTTIPRIFNIFSIALRVNAA